MSKTRFVMIGGFLGAGKTTAIVRLADHVCCQGHRAGLITNDQSQSLVDTARVRAAGFAVEEITGGCFCCRFNSLIAASEQLTRSTTPDVLIAEPVGSCTDLVATVSYPLRQLYGDSYEIATYSVLIDPIRCRQILGPQRGTHFSDNVAYVYREQLEEAELLVINKIDLLDQLGRNQLYEMLQSTFPQGRILEVSCKSGEGIATWFEEILNGELGRRPAMAVDYDVYADGEARLGWLNATASLRGTASFDGNQLLSDLANHLRRTLISSGGEIAHLKMTLAPTGSSSLAAISVTRSDSEPQVTHVLKGSATHCELTINLRAEVAPEMLKEQVLAGLSSLSPVEADVHVINSFRPGRPNPTHRMATSDAWPNKRDGSEISIM